MAALFDEMDTKCCQACESPKIAYICTDCTGPRLHLCKDCYKGHVTAGHKVVDINEYQKNPSKYQLAVERECKTHQGKLLELVCSLCNMLLCLMCPHDSSITCEKTPGGKGTHKTGPLKTAVETDKKIIDESLRKAAHIEADVNAAVNRLKKKKDDARAQHNRVKDDAEKHERKLITAIKAKTKCVIDKSERNLEVFNTEVDKTLEDMGHFLENLRGTREEAEGLKSSSADVTVHRLTSSVVERLTTPFTLPELDVVTLKLEPPTKFDEDELEKLVGSLVSFRKGNALVDGDNIWAPANCCLMKTSKGTALVEAFVEYGLFHTAAGKARKKISADGVGHRSVCMSPDEKMIYSTTCKNTICKYTVEDDSLNLVGEVTVEGAKQLVGIRALLTTGTLAVLDNHALRITLHDKAATLLRSIENVLQGGNTQNLEWSPSGEYLFITDAGKGDVEKSVVKLKVEPAEIIWRKPLDIIPRQVRHVGRKMYITNGVGSWKTVTVMSAEDGSTINTIAAPGTVSEIRQSPHADLECVHY